MSTPTTRPTIVTPTMNPALDITTDTEWVLPTGKPWCRAPRYDPGGGRTAGLFFAATVIYLPALLSIFGTAALTGWMLLMVIPMPFAVWGTDELYRWRIRQQATP